MKAEDILHHAALLIGDRAKERDHTEERSMKRAFSLFNALTDLYRIDEPMTEREGWLFMICLKMARGTAGSFRLDDWEDAAAYCALLAECEINSQREGEVPQA